MIAPAVVLGFCAVICTLLFTFAWKQRAQYNQTLTVAGSAVQSFGSDLGILRGSLGASGSSIQDSFAGLSRQKPLLLSYLKGEGFVENMVEFYPPTFNTVYKYDQHGNQTGEILRYEYYQRFALQSQQVELIQKLSLNLAGLVDQGVFVTVEPPEYIYTKLADLKIDVQAAAAKDALERAARIAEATQARLGPMRSARMGVLQITPLHSTQVSDYGINDTSSIQKQITAVVTASFGIVARR